MAKCLPSLENVHVVCCKLLATRINAPNGQLLVYNRVGCSLCNSISIEPNASNLADDHWPVICMCTIDNDINQ